MREIIFSGAKDIGIYSLKSLQQRFEKIYILDITDDEIKALKRPQDEMIDDFSAVPCKYVFLGGHFGFITEKQLKEKVYINIHGALLPHFRGLHSFFWGIMNFEEYLGLTVHLVNSEMDGGDIIHQFKCKYREQPMSEIYEELFSQVELELANVVEDYMDGKIIAQPQNKEEALWACRRNLEDCLIDFTWSNKIIKRYFLALTAPYPLPRILFRNKYYEVTKAKVIDKEYFVTVGRCLNVDDEGVWIKTAEGFLIVEEIRDVDTLEVFQAKELIPIGYRFIK